MLHQKKQSCLPSSSVWGAFLAAVTAPFSLIRKIYVFKSFQELDKLMQPSDYKVSGPPAPIPCYGLPPHSAGKLLCALDITNLLESLASQPSALPTLLLPTVVLSIPESVPPPPPPSSTSLLTQPIAVSLTGSSACSKSILPLSSSSSTEPKSGNSVCVVVHKK